MERTPLLPLPEGMLINQIQDAETRVIVTVVATSPTSCCPTVDHALITSVVIVNFPLHALRRSITLRNILD